MTQQRLIGSTEAATLLGRSPRTIHRMVAAGTLKPAMTAPGGPNGTLLFNLADIEDLAASTAERKASA